MLMLSSVCIASTKVSILVFVELALDVRSHKADQSGTNVSILVFVELALDVTEGERKELRDRCFNPCFRGTCS